MNVKFLIDNPAESECVSFGLWYDYGTDKEYPLIVNTGGCTLQVSLDKKFGDSDGIEPTLAFWDYLANIPRNGGKGRYKQYVGSFPDKMPVQEKWALAEICSFLLIEDSVSEGLKELLEEAEKRPYPKLKDFEGIGDSPEENLG